MKSSTIKRALLGLLFIAGGVFFLAWQFNPEVRTLNLGYIVSTFWPAILIYIGIGTVLSDFRAFWGWLIAALGIYFLGRNLGWITLELGELLPYAIPVGLIMIGISLFMKPKKEKAMPEEQPAWTAYDEADYVPPPPLHPDPTLDGHSLVFEQNELDGQYGQKRDMSKVKTKGCHTPRERIEWWDHASKSQTRSSFIGDLHLGKGYWEVQPMNISHFIGDTVLDLTKAQIPYGETKIVISSFIGDVKLFLPNDLETAVHLDFSAFIGDAKMMEHKEGGMFSSTSMESPHYAEADKQIRLVVSTFIGDVRVKRVG